MAVTAALYLTLDLATAPTLRRWAGIGAWPSVWPSACAGVFMPAAGLLLIYALWHAGRRTVWRQIVVGLAVVAALILPWTINNYLVFHRFLLLNSQAGQILWNANHPEQGGVRCGGHVSHSRRSGRRGRVTLNDELTRRGLQEIAPRTRQIRPALPEQGRGLLRVIAQTRVLAHQQQSAGSFPSASAFRSWPRAWPSLREWRRWLLPYLLSSVTRPSTPSPWTMIRYPDAGGRDPRSICGIGSG